MSTPRPCVRWRGSPFTSFTASPALVKALPHLLIAFQWLLQCTPAFLLLLFFFTQWVLGDGLCLSAALSVFGMPFKIRSLHAQLQSAVQRAPLSAFSLVFSIPGSPFFGALARNLGLWLPPFDTLPTTLPLSRPKQQEYWHRKKKKSNGCFPLASQDHSTPKVKGGSPQF